MVSVSDILTYEGSKLDSGLNYTALALSIVPLLLIFHRLPLNENKWRRYLWCLVFVGLSCFQIELCIAVACSGISIIWSALASFNLYLYYLWVWKLKLYKRNEVQVINSTLFLSWLYTIFLLIYYAIFAEALTSIAHFCALVLGLLIAVLITSLMFRDLTTFRFEGLEEQIPLSQNR